MADKQDSLSFQDKQELMDIVSDDLDNMSFSERLTYYKKEEVVDITGGLRHLVHDSNEFIEFVTEMLDDGQPRFPILGMKDGRVLMVGHSPRSGRYAHGEILNIIGKKIGDVDYSTSMEGIYSAAEAPYLELKITKDAGYFKAGSLVKIQLRRGSDLQGNISFDMKSDLQQIFGGIDDVKICYGK